MQEKHQVATTDTTPSPRKRKRGRRNRRAGVEATVVKSSQATASVVLDYLTKEDEEYLPGSAVAPPYDFAKLYKLFEASWLLRPCVDAYATNIDGFGQHYTPAIDLKAEDADQRISDAIYYENYLASERGETDSSMEFEPGEEEVFERKEELARTARIEFIRLRAFFTTVSPECSFTQLRKRSRQDLEVIGNAFWEVVRNALGELTYFYYVRPLDVRLITEDDQDVEVEERVPVTDITWKTVTRTRRFRRFVKLSSAKGQPVYFKEYGDPRVVSRGTGTVFESSNALREEEGPEALEAHEILHFKIFSPTTPYGIPRWIANLLAALGSRELDEVNHNFFNNNVVPPLALLCSGGRFGKGVNTKIEEFIDEHLKGRKGMHRILVLEAEGQKTAGDVGPRTVPKIQFVPLRDAQQQDALFQNYDGRNEEKMAKSFRRPRLLRGDDSQINRSVAFASMRFAEEQVFEPEREDFDDIMNRKILSELEISFWHFRSNAPVTRDPETMGLMVERLVKAGILLPKEGRELASDMFNRTFLEISEDWTNRPLPLSLAQLSVPKDRRLDQIGDPEESEHEGDSIPSGYDPQANQQTQERSAAKHTPRGSGAPLRALGADAT
jgi:PBSX family phage portal protein